MNFVVVLLLDYSLLNIERKRLHFEYLSTDQSQFELIPNLTKFVNLHLINFLFIMVSFVQNLNLLIKINPNSNLRIVNHQGKEDESFEK